MQDLNALFATMHAATRQGAAPTWPERQARLQALRRLLLENKDAICAAINADFGNRPWQETQLLEMLQVLSEIDCALKKGKSWMRPRHSWASLWLLPARNEVLPQPKGVVGISVPWNYPLMLALCPLAGALAAGNSVLLKFAEDSAQFARLLQDLVAQYFAPEVLRVVCSAPGVAQAFVALPFDHLLFTGSSAAGQKVMAAASQNLTPVTLELGGKSPVLLLPDADVARAAAAIIRSKLLNAGQTCLAPDYVLLRPEQVAPFIEAAKAWVNKHYPDIAHSPDYTRIINAKQYARLVAMQKEAEQAGVQCLDLGTGASCPQDRVLLPQLLIEPPTDLRIMQEEIFGPLLPLLVYENVDDAIVGINARPRPLALYVFGKEPKAIREVLAHTRSGGVTVNDCLLHVTQHDLPFGGLGASGMGHYHGKFGFDTFSHQRAVLHQSRWSSAGMTQPPYGKKLTRLLRWMIR